MASHRGQSALQLWSGSHWYVLERTDFFFFGFAAVIPVKTITMAFTYTVGATADTDWSLAGRGTVFLIVNLQGIAFACTSLTLNLSLGIHTHYPNPYHVEQVVGYSYPLSKSIPCGTGQVWVEDRIPARVWARGGYYSFLQSPLDGLVRTHGRGTVQTTDYRAPGWRRPRVPVAMVLASTLL
jgi:hypothetical protein